MNAARRTRALKGFVLGVTFLAASAVMAVPAGPQTLAAPVDLGTADPFAILAGTEITDVPESAITGDVGLTPETGANIIGLTCDEVNGTIYSVDAAGPLPCRVTDPALLTAAKNALSAAYVDAAGRTADETVPTELGGQTLSPGVYNSAATTFSITAGAGPLILDAQGDPNGVFIFQAPADQADALTVGPGSEVQLTGGAQACNVWWAVVGATIDTTAIFKGNILAATSITVAQGANIEGRLLALEGNVTLIQDAITRADCAVSPGPTVPRGPAAAPPTAIVAPPNFTG
ncbi:MAG TPA: ice-binding family protein [Acidimicrobiia bacterium]|nr:ice-binding family protein [Acidimicrobiia bacterium]